MEKFYTECLDHFKALHNEVKRSIQDMSVEALDWIPASETNSINVLVTHLTAAEKFWAVDLVLGRTSTRVRSEEFEVVQYSQEDLLSRLDEALLQIQEGFEQLTLADLGLLRHSKHHDMDISVAWAILHALEHTAQHVGHIQLTAQLWMDSAKEA